MSDKPSKPPKFIIDQGELPAAVQAQAAKRRALLKADVAEAEASSAIAPAVPTVPKLVSKLASAPLRVFPIQVHIGAVNIPMEAHDCVVTDKFIHLVIPNKGLSFVLNSPSDPIECTVEHRGHKYLAEHLGMQFDLSFMPARSITLLRRDKSDANTHSAPAVSDELPRDDEDGAS